MKKFLVRFWPLPPVERRKAYPFFIRFDKTIRLNRDGDYLCYQAGALVYYLGITVLFLMLLDIFFGWNWLVDQTLLSQKKIYFVSVWLDVVQDVAALILLLFYLRVRLVMDIKNDPVPVFFKKSAVLGKERRELIFLSIFAVAVSLVPFVFSYTGEEGVVRRLGASDNLFATIIWQGGFIFGLSFFSCWAMSSFLLLEKAIRFFPELHEDLKNL